MTLYADLAPQIRLLLAGMVFLAAFLELVLVLYCAVGGRRWKRVAAEGGIYLFLLVFISFSVGAYRMDDDPIYPIRLPYFVYLFAALIVTLHVAHGLRKEYRSYQNGLSRNSVREALDKLETGVAFFDASGRIILINRSMNHLFEILHGGLPQTADEMRRALKNPSEEAGVVRMENEPMLYRFPDGKVWRFSEDMLEETALSGMTRLTAWDMTELHRVNEKLREDNEAIRKSITKMKEMIAKMADRVREEEALNLKMRIHNDIGASLIALSEMATGERTENASAEMDTLSRALSYLSGGSAKNAESDDLPYRFAADCGVKLYVIGEAPRDEKNKALITAAVRECVTNCARHAGGTLVTIRFSETDESDLVEITNDGEVPRGPIVEGGGLSSLRRKVKNAGGGMTILFKPCFSLQLTLPKGSDCE